MTALNDLLDSLVELRDRKDELSRQLKGVNAAIDEAIDAAVELMAQEGTRSIKRDDGTTFSVRVDLKVSVPKSNQPDLVGIFGELGLADLVETGVPTARLKSWLIEQLEADAEDHGGIRPDFAESSLDERVKRLVSVFEKPTISIRRG